MPELETFERFITSLPKEASVLEVGVCGHEGENTSRFLAAYFNKVTGITIDQRAIAYCREHFKNYELIQDNFYNHRFNYQYDLLVLDLTIESNVLNDWSETGLERAWKLLKPGGFLINFVMMTDQYGDPDVTPALIRWHSQRFWHSEVPNPTSVGKKLAGLKNFELYLAGPELRRPYIFWVMLKKK